MGCRLPGADGLDEYWALLSEGVDAITEVPPDRWDVDSLWTEDQTVRGRTHCRWGGFVEHGDWFQVELFGINAREAERMDPQQGLVLECAWQALEHACLAPDSLAGSDTGVFVGISNSDFDRKLCRDLTNLDVRAGTGTSYSIVANRLSYVLGLCGPSVAIDLACSSSLAAVHLACQSLWLGESELCLAGGVHLILSPEKTVTFSCGNLLAKDGRCRAFSDGADGYVRGEGCGIVVLKRLDDAQRDRDRICGIIRGSAINHNGRSNGLSAPFGPAQRKLIRRALRVGDIPPASIGYVEAHGAGTRIGDAIEVSALISTLSEQRAPQETCLIGSVKSNLGHLEAAAGVASLIKVLLAIQHGTIPKTLHAGVLNANLRLEKTPFRVAQESETWPPANVPRRAGISSFSFGGANAHIVVEQAPASNELAAATESGWLVLPLSALNTSALRNQARRYAAHLSAGEMAADFGNACFTAAVARAHLTHRLAVVARTSDEAARALTRYADGDESVVPSLSGQGPTKLIYAFGELDRRIERDTLPTIARNTWDVWLIKAGERIRGDFADATERDQVAFAEVLAAVNLLAEWGIRPTGLYGADDFGRRVARLVLTAQATRLSTGEARTHRRCSPPVLLDSCQTGCHFLRLGDHATGSGGNGTMFADASTVALLVFGTIRSDVICHARGAVEVVSERPNGLLHGVAAAYMAHVGPDWRRFYCSGQFRRCPLPLYQFDRRRHWNVPSEQDVPAVPAPSNAAWSLRRSLRSIGRKH
jgi:acyl transferase domain-containing protein